MRFDDQRLCSALKFSGGGSWEWRLKRTTSWSCVSLQRTVAVLCAHVKPESAVWPNGVQWHWVELVSCMAQRRDVTMPDGHRDALFLLLIHSHAASAVSPSRLSKLPFTRRTVNNNKRPLTKTFHSGVQRLQDHIVFSSRRCTYNVSSSFMQFVI